MTTIIRNLTQTVIPMENGYTLTVSSLRGGAPMAPRWDTAVLFCDDPDGNNVWQAEVTHPDLIPTDAHEALVDAINSLGILPFRKQHCRYLEA